MATANPNWMMLEPFVFRGDDAGSFLDEGGAPFKAHGFTSRGDAITVSLHIRPPPAISRLYLQWPSGPDPKKGGSSCDLVAAHGNLLLLRLTSSPLPSLKNDEAPVYPQEHFICRASSSSTIKLERIPAPLVLIGNKDKPVTEQDAFPLNTVGILCRGEQDFAIAQLRLSRPSRGVHMAADLCVFRSDVRTRECDHKWEIEQHLPIQFKETMESSDLTYWRTDKVLPFKTSLLWVDYCGGGILSSEVFQASPTTVSYLRLPIPNRNPRYEARHFQDMRRCVCVTKDGQEVNFVDVVCEDSKTFGKMILPAVFSVACYALRTTTTTESGGAGSDYYWDKVFSVKSDELEGPLEHLTYPLVSIDKANIAHFLMSEKVLDGINKVWVVTVDMSAKEIVSVCPYINGVEDLQGKDDAEMIKQKSRILQPFIPSELSKFL